MAARRLKDRDQASHDNEPAETPKQHFLCRPQQRSGRLGSESSLSGQTHAPGHAGQRRRHPHSTEHRCCPSPETGGNRRLQAAAPDWRYGGSTRQSPKPTRWEAPDHRNRLTLRADVEITSRGYQVVVTIIPRPCSKTKLDP